MRVFPILCVAALALAAWSGAGCAHPAAQKSGKSLTLYNGLSAGKYLSAAPQYESSGAFATPLELRWQIDDAVGVGAGYESTNLSSVTGLFSGSDEPVGTVTGATFSFNYRLPINKSGVFDVTPRVTLGDQLLFHGVGNFKVGVSALVGALGFDYSESARDVGSSGARHLRLRSGIFTGLEVGFLMIGPGDMAPYVSFTILSFELGFGW